MRLFRNETGISNLIATLILIAVAVVGGAFAYTAFREQAGSTTTSADLQVQDLTVIRTGDPADVSPNIYLSVTIKNVGTQRLNGVDTTVDPDGTDVTLPIAEILPGETDSESTSITTDQLNAGQTYPVRIVAETPDGGSIAKTMTVRVKS